MIGTIYNGNCRSENLASYDHTGPIATPCAPRSAVYWLTQKRKSSLQTVASCQSPILSKELHQFRRPPPDPIPVPSRSHTYHPSGAEVCKGNLHHSVPFLAGIVATYSRQTSGIHEPDCAVATAAISLLLVLNLVLHHNTFYYSYRWRLYSVWLHEGAISLASKLSLNPRPRLAYRHNIICKQCT